jgi:hypothetical protein
MANQRLVRRLAGEVLHARDVVGDTVRDLDVVRSHDEKLQSLTSNALERMSELIENMDMHDQTFNAFQKLYKMQRDRMDAQMKRVETDRHRWLETAAGLAIRLAEEHNLEEVKDLNQFEYLRFRAAIHIITELDSMNQTELGSVIQQIDQVRRRLSKLTSDIIEDDRKYHSQLHHVLQAIKDTFERLVPANVTDTELDLNNPLLKDAFGSDSRLMGQQLGEWLRALTPAVNRFTTDKSTDFTREIVTIRAFTDHWVTATKKFLRRCMETSSGREYRERLAELDTLDKEIFEWLKKLERRVTGDESIIGAVVRLHGQLEDRCTALAMRVDETFTALEFQQLYTAIEKWRNDLMLTLALYRCDLSNRCFNL